MGRSLRNPLLMLGALALGSALALACGSNNNGNGNSAAAPAATQAATVASVASATTAAAPSTVPTSGVSPAGTATASALPVCPPGGAATSLTGAGSTFDNPLFSKLFDTYNQQCKIQVNYQSIGSGGGIEQLTKKTVNFGATDAPLTDEQTKAAGGDTLHIPVTIAAVALAYNIPGVKAGLKLNGDTLTRIYMGTIKKWNDPAIKALNSGLSLPDLDIAVAHRSDGSGTSFIFTSYLSAVSPDWKSRVGAGTSVEWPTGAGGKGSEGVAGIVKQTPGGLGYFELAYATQNNLATVTMQNKDGQFVEPSVDSASAAAAGAIANLPPDLRAIFVDAPGAKTYPISGFSWVVINQAQSDQAIATSLVYLLWWTTHQGQTFSRDLTYAPLPGVVVTLDEAQLRKVTVNGKPVLNP